MERLIRKGYKSKVIKKKSQTPKSLAFTFNERILNKNTH